MLMNLRFVVSFIAVVSMMAFSPSVCARKNKLDKETFEWRYEIEPTVGQAHQGSCMVKVWTYAKKANRAAAQAAKNAVHGIIFKGYAAKNGGNVRIPAQKPLVSDSKTEQENEAWFKEFFKDGGRYMQFVTLVNNGAPASGDLIKVGKEYKMGIVVVVRKDELRKELENAGIIRSLNSGF